MAAWELNPLSRRLFDDGRQRRAGAAVLMLAALLAFAGGLLWHGGCGGSLPCCLLEDGTAVRARAAGPPLEVVVAHFAGNLSFVPSLLAELGGSPKLTVYSKSPEPPTGAIQLPNVGREGHAFLAHLHSRYHSLADITIFVMDSAELSSDKRAALRELAAAWRRARSHGFLCGGLDRHRPKAGYQIERWQGTTDESGAGSRSAHQRERSGPRLEPASPRPFGAWFAEYVGGELPRAWCPGAIMAVHRSRARQRPRSFYAALLAQLAVGPNLEAGHFLERSWASIFYLRCQP